MKKMILICATLGLLTTTAYAASSASLHLTGAVTKKLNISIDVLSVALDLTANKSDFKVATITEKSNSSNGYKVTIASSNLGKLKRNGGVELFNYTLKYGASPLGLSAAAGASISNATVGVVTQSKDVLISYTGALPETMVEGSYEDILTFTISAN